MKKVVFLIVIILLSVFAFYQSNYFSEQSVELENPTTNHANAPDGSHKASVGGSSASNLFESMKERDDVTRTRKQFLSFESSLGFYAEFSNPGLTKLIFPVNPNIIFPSYEDIEGKDEDDVGCSIADKAELAFRMAVSEPYFYDLMEASYQYYVHAFKRKNWRSEQRVYFIATAVTTGRLDEAEKITADYTKQILVQIKNKKGRFVESNRGHIIIPLVMTASCNYIEMKLKKSQKVSNERLALLKDKFDRLRKIAFDLMHENILARAEALESFLSETKPKLFKTLKASIDYKIEMLNVWSIGDSLFYVIDKASGNLIFNDFSRTQLFKFSGGGKALYVRAKLVRWEKVEKDEYKLFDVSDQGLEVRYRYKPRSRTTIEQMPVVFQFFDVKDISKMFWTAEFDSEDEFDVYSVAYPGNYQGSYNTDRFLPWRQVLMPKETKN